MLQSVGGEHFYTTDASEAWTVFQNPGWVGENAPGWLYHDQVPGSVPLYRWHFPYSPYGAYFETIHTDEFSSLTQWGWILERVEGYCFPTQQPGTIPLYHAGNPISQDHLYTADFGEIGRLGYSFWRTECYVLPP